MSTLINFDAEGTLPGYIYAVFRTRPREGDGGICKRRAATQPFAKHVNDDCDCDPQRDSIQSNHVTSTAARRGGIVPEPVEK